MTRTIIIAAGTVTAAWLIPAPAEAARCPQGSIYRQSHGVCQNKAAALRQGIRIYNRAEPRRIKRKPPVQRARAPAPKSSPYGALLPMPEIDSARLMMWAAKNMEVSYDE
jgi:hypothetical protein